MPKSILVVDDSRSIRQLLGVTLRGSGYEVVEAADGEEALEFARRRAVDLVLTDVYMPHMDGITLVAQLRTLASYYLTPLLLLTIDASPERKLQGKQAGATGWITKPFSPPQLLPTLERLLGGDAAVRA